MNVCVCERGESLCVCARVCACAHVHAFEKDIVR